MNERVEKNSEISDVSILVVDDEPAIRRVTARILTNAGYTVVEAETLASARAARNEHRPHVALVDLHLKDESGAALLDDEWAQKRDTAIVVVTGSDDVGVAHDAFERGAYGYVVKPFTPNELVMQVMSALRRRELERAAIDHVHELEHKVVAGSADLRALRERLERVSTGADVGDAEEVIARLASAVCLRDDDTGRHIKRVSLTAAALADWRGFTTDPKNAIQLAAAMHDVGKIGIPDWVLLKPGRLTADETEIIQRHCELGYALLGESDAPVMQLAASVALDHHERWDGTGYPNRKRGEDIPLVARITSVADVFDALTRDRVYRAALPVETAIDIMVRDRGGLFDPDLLDLFIDHIDDVIALTADLPDPVVQRVTRIVLVDDEQILLDGLLRIMNRRDETRVLASAGTLRDALDAVAAHRPDVLVTDYRLPDGDAAELTERVLASFPETKVLVLTGSATAEVALRCVSAGCAGIVSKTAPIEELVAAIRRVHDGEVAIPQALLPHVMAGLRPARARLGDDITPRERELLGHLAEGKALPDVAHAMSISINTARNHTQRVLEKLDAHSKLEAVVIATREKIIAGRL